MSQFKSWVKSGVDKLFHDCSFRVPFGIARGLRVRGVQGVLRNPRLSKEEQFYFALNLSNKTVYDIGGHVGIMALFFSRMAGSAGSVITMEPNPINVSRIKDNLALNCIQNVEVIQTAVGDQQGRAELVFGSTETAMGSLNKEIKESIELDKESIAITVDIDLLDQIVESRRLKMPDFVKIDVEGFEINVLRGMKKIIEKVKPELFLEVHGMTYETKEKNVKEIVQFLLENKYSVYHVESETPIQAENTAVAREGHLYAKG